MSRVFGGSLIFEVVGVERKFVDEKGREKE